MPDSSANDGSSGSGRFGNLRLPRIRGHNSNSNSNNSDRRSSASINPNAAARNASGRNSGVWDGSGSGRAAAVDHRMLSSGSSTTAPTLRSKSSRFSLSDQFAATRQEYALWDEESILERTTLASQDGGDFDEDDDDTEGPASFLIHDVDEPGPNLDIDGDAYDLLCLPRDAEFLTPADVRRAYHRLFLLFYPDSYPEHLRPLARRYFVRAQHAFEALVDPARRAQYDVGRLAVSFASASTSESEYEAAFQRAVWQRLQRGPQTSSDLGLRLDATGVALGRRRAGPWQRGPSTVGLLDFALSHSVSARLPTFRLPRRSAGPSALGSSMARCMADVEFTEPVVTVSGSVYTAAQDLSQLPTSLLYDGYQPVLPPTITRQRLVQLVENRLSPLVTVRYQQAILNLAKPPASDHESWHWVKTEAEVESDILPELCTTSRLYHHISLPAAMSAASSSPPKEPSSSAPPSPSTAAETERPVIVIETAIHSSRHVLRTPLRLVVGTHGRIHGGTAYGRLDSGDWAFEPSRACRFFADFARLNPNMFGSQFPLKTPPALELGFKTDATARALVVPASGRPDVPGIDGGIRGLDYELDASSPGGSWAVSASASPTSLRGFVRYSRDLSLPFLIPADPSSPPTPAPGRVEAELSSSTIYGRHLAVRNLWTVGRFARLGLEVGTSAHSLHVSLYWSRLGQRLSLPLLIAPQAVASPGVVFWAAALPFTAVAAAQLLLQYFHSRRSRRNPRNGSSDSAAVSEAAAAIITTRQRNEADSLTVLLAQPVEARQRHQQSRRGLVILSAKYGVPDAEIGGGSGSGSVLAGELVADVTIAVAALVDDGPDGAEPSLTIPRGVRKSRIPGFWDPAPGADKVLQVRYSYKGVEGVVEVNGREELRVPTQGLVTGEKAHAV